MTFLIGRRGLLALALVLGAGFAVPPGAVAQALPDYDAKAGMLNIGQNPERPDAEIFHVAYTLKGADPATRPVTFIFNGGPAAASIYLHLAAIGPKTIVTAGDGSFPPVPARLEENPDSWITFTDLVFIDPVGTGFSRMLPGPDGKPEGKHQKPPPPDQKWHLCNLRSCVMPNLHVSDPRFTATSTSCHPAA